MREGEGPAFYSDGWGTETIKRTKNLRAWKQKPLKKNHLLHKMPAPSPFKQNDNTRVRFAYDFATQYSPEHFRNVLGDDGLISLDTNRGLIVNSAPFQIAQPQGPQGSLERYKCVPTFHNLFDVTRGKEDIFVGFLSSAQSFNKRQPFPERYGRRLECMTEDPRLAHGRFMVTDVRTGLHMGFMVTDDQVYVSYGRDSNLVNLIQSQGTKCEPCSRDVAYTRNNFTEDPTYQLFKQNLTEEDYRRFIVFAIWSHYACAQGIDVFTWKRFNEFQKEHPDICAASRSAAPYGTSSQFYINWKAYHDWDEYELLPHWNRWLDEYLQLKSCEGTDCSNGGCSSKPGCGSCGSSQANPTCVHKFTDNRNCFADCGGNCDAPDRCCCPRMAEWEDIVPIEMASEACNPLNDLVKYAVGIDRSRGRATFYINNTEVHCIRGLGLRHASKYRTVSLGGKPELIDVSQVSVSGGTAHQLDGALTDNSAKIRITPDNRAVSAFTPLAPSHRYVEIYKTKTGKQPPVIPNETFAEPGSKESDKNFGQGVVFVWKSFFVLQRVADPDYRDPIDGTRRTECCGGMITDQCQNNRNTIKPCGDEGVTADAVWDFLNPANFLQVWFEDNPNRKRVMGDDAGVAGLREASRGFPQNGGGGAGCNNGGYSGRAKIQKIGRGERGYLVPDCNDSFTPIE